MAWSSYTTLSETKPRSSTTSPWRRQGAKADMFEIVPGSGGFYGWENVRDDANIIGHRSVAIPGTVAGLCAALERYGTMSPKEVLAPAIDLAENGVDVDDRIAILIARETRYFRQLSPS